MTTENKDFSKSSTGMDVSVVPPLETQKQPGTEQEMNPRPRDCMKNYKAAGKLEGKVALVTGGDSGIGRATAIGFAKEGANVAIIYTSAREEEDAAETLAHIKAAGRDGISIRGDVGDKAFCEQAVKQVLRAFGGLNILVNNAGEQHECKEVTEITPEQLLRTFQTNIFGMFYMVQSALPQLNAGDCIINTASITAYRGNPVLIDYSATKGAIVSFTRSLADNLSKKKIRVNAVAPGPIWTPLIPSSFDAQKAEDFGTDTAFGRPGQPDEVAPSFIFLASDDASYMSGQVLHPNGGEVING